ncbi:MAG: hypothetical protein JWM14_2166 [Chitinophagaceae bacterium]|nr:hypothetical protein [Chitinophagaceae bacterium]
MKKSAITQLFFVLFLLLPMLSYAQSEGMTDEHKAYLEAQEKMKKQQVPDSLRFWRRGITPAINFSQVNLSNWSGGGQNSVSFTALVSAFLNYEKKKWSWYNNLDMGYGLSRIGTSTAPWIKNEDKIIYVEKLSYRIGEHSKISWLNDFRTQFAEGRRYFKSETTGADTSQYVSNFMAPAYLTSALGYEYNPNKNFFLFVSPVTAKFTCVNDPILSAVGAYGVKPYNTFRAEFGALMNAKLQFSIAENITFSSTLTAFANYETLDRIDIFSDNSLLFKVNKFVTASFTANMIYDDDIKITRGDGTIGPDLQYKHVLSVGITTVIGDRP